MTRDAAIRQATEHFDSGDFFEDLARRVAIPSSAQVRELRPELDRYLAEEMTPTLENLGFQTAIHPNPDPRGGPFLVAERLENPNLPTMFSYGHGDVVRGFEGDWREGRDPWTMVKGEAGGTGDESDRWYGRGTADNKGQHSVNLAALAAVLAVRGRLGFNCKILLEMSEEVGSVGLAEFAAEHREELRADLLLASDGPRLAPDKPTLFMGSRGVLNFELTVDLREGAHHSGNWGGLISNAGTRLANALATLVGPKGEILLPALRPEAIPASVRTVLSEVKMGGGHKSGGGPKIEEDWGQPGLTPAERVFAWNAFEVLAMKVGNPDQVANAIPPDATAWCQIRFTVDRDPETFLPAIRAHLDDHGYHDVAVGQRDGFMMKASRLLPDHPWVQWARASLQQTTGVEPAILPNLGGALPNDVFAETLGLPTIWVPHSYAACSQHAPNEHALAPVLREGLQIMTGLFWDLGEGDLPEWRTA
ncbi:MAG: M20 family metallopeptidase [Alphaproteobacteria bacterium]|jgi:acetylornithine deacetylase/succinyl-diaminopimelate desuccinylase-like protein|nr:M20 family metallopeptidase [Alphaproteobacteria bacterium]